MLQIEQFIKKLVFSRKQLENMYTKGKGKAHWMVQHLCKIHLVQWTCMLYISFT